MSARGAKWNAIVLGSVAAAGLGVVIAGSLAEPDDNVVESLPELEQKASGKLHIHLRRFAIV